MTDTETPTHEEAVAKVAELVKDARIGMLTTTAPDGKLVSRPMGLQQVEFDGDLWFFAETDSDKVTEMTADPQVNVAFGDGKGASWTSVSGTAELVTDKPKAQELWNPLLKAWFPEGLDTPDLGLIKVHADTVEYWDSPGSKVVRLLGIAKAAVKRDPDAFPGENETVEL